MVQIRIKNANSSSCEVWANERMNGKLEMNLEKKEEKKK